MSGKGVKTVPCDSTIRKGRLDKARQFAEAAEMIDTLAEDEADLIDAYVTLCVHAGIAAADVICCSGLNEHAAGESHSQATGLLAKVDPAASKHLRALLQMKTRIGYSANAGSTKDRKQAKRALEQLIKAAIERP